MRGFSTLFSRTGLVFAWALASFAWALAALAPRAGRADEAAAPQTDPVLARLIEESLAARPELKAADASTRADRERVRQAESLPDPVLTLGIQNDGFTGIQIGSMETSFVQIMASQTFPWPGKRGLRGEVAALGADQTMALVQRLRLGTEADVRRAYLDLQVVRARLALLERLTALWQRSQDLARARYEVGSAPQSDILRAQLEQTRLKQRALALRAEERLALQSLNRLRAHPLDEEIATPGGFADGPEPVVLPLATEVADAEARSPELAAARLVVRQAGKQVDLAHKEQYPDITVSAGVMPRGSLEPMWQAGVSFNLPFLWGRGRRTSAIHEADLRSAAGAESAEGIAQVLRQRVAERHVALDSLRETARLYREGLLVQSETTVESTLAQYRVGKVTFAAVLDALAGYVADEDAYLQVRADLERVAIARAEAGLDPVGLSGASLSAGGMPGSGGMAPRNAAKPTPVAVPEAAAPM